VETGIGATLREARSRRKLDLAEVEAAIKIRARYLQAIENEEWDVLPGVAYARGFVRTYAIYLGLDGERLADEYKRTVTVAAAGAGERTPKRVEPVPASSRGERRRISGGLLATAVVIALTALAVAIGLAGGDEDGTSIPEPGESAEQRQRRAASRTTAATPKPGVVLSLAATGEVWVCLVDAGEDALVDGEILTDGAEAGPFRSRRFEIALGNGSVEMTVDGQEADLAPSASPVGYLVDVDTDLTPLEEGERPDCE
jgi:hypothetical protein